MCGWLAGPFAIAALVCFLAAVLRTGDRRRAVEAVGWCLIGLGLFVWALLHVLGSIASRSGDTVLQGDAIRAVFWSTTNLLSIQSAIVVTAGAVLAVAGAYSGTTNLQTRGHLLWHGMWRRLEQPAWKGMASIALIAVAIVAMMWPAGTAAVVIRILAFAAFVAGAVGLLDLVGSRRWSSDTVGTGRVKVSTRRCRRWDASGSASPRAPCSSSGAWPSCVACGRRGPAPQHRRDRVQRLSGAVRQAHRRGRVRRHAQLDVGQRRRLHRSQPARRHPDPARRVACGRCSLDLHYGFRVDSGVRTDMCRAPETPSEPLTPRSRRL